MSEQKRHLTSWSTEVSSHTWKHQLRIRTPGEAWFQLLQLELWPAEFPLERRHALERNPVLRRSLSRLPSSAPLLRGQRPSEPDMIAACLRSGESADAEASSRLLNPRSASQSAGFPGRRAEFLLAAGMRVRGIPNTSRNEAFWIIRFLFPV